MDALRDVGIEALLTSDRFDHVDVDTVGAVVEEFVRFVDDVVAPTDRDGDVVEGNADRSLRLVGSTPTPRP